MEDKKNKNLVHNIKKTWKEIYNDYKKKGLVKETFVANDRLLYIGLTIIIFALVISAYDVIFYDDSPKGNIQINDLQDLKRILN